MNLKALGGIFNRSSGAPAQARTAAAGVTRQQSGPGNLASFSPRTAAQTDTGASRRNAFLQMPMGHNQRLPTPAKPANPNMPGIDAWLQGTQIVGAPSMPQFGKTPFINNALRRHENHEQRLASGGSTYNRLNEKIASAFSGGRPATPATPPSSPSLSSFVTPGGTPSRYTGQAGRPPAYSPPPSYSSGPPSYSSYANKPPPPLPQMSASPGLSQQSWNKDGIVGFSGTLIDHDLKKTSGNPRPSSGFAASMTDSNAFTGPGYSTEPKPSMWSRFKSAVSEPAARGYSRTDSY